MFNTTISPLRVAHRGGAALAPENSLAAFHRALTLPIEAMELDVQMSRDGQALVFHDETVERLTEGAGNLLDLDLAYLRSLDVAAHLPGGWPERQQMPLLAEVLELVRPSAKGVFLEIKASKQDGVYGRYPGIAEAVAEAVLAANLLERVLFISFDWQVLPLVQKLAPGAITGILVSEDLWQPGRPEALTGLAERALALGCSWINLDEQLFTPDMPYFFHALGLRLGLWTVNEAASLRRLAAAGVDALTTDHPERFTSRS